MGERMDVCAVREVFIDGGERADRTQIAVGISDWAEEDMTEEPGKGEMRVLEVSSQSLRGCSSPFETKLHVDTDGAVMSLGVMGGCVVFSSGPHVKVARLWDESEEEKGHKEGLRKAGELVTQKTDGFTFIIDIQICQKQHTIAVLDSQRAVRLLLLSRDTLVTIGV